MKMLALVDYAVSDCGQSLLDHLKTAYSLLAPLEGQPA